MDQQQDEFLKTRVNWGLILRADLETIDHIKRFVAKQPDVLIAYQTVDAGRLWIVRENERGQVKKTAGNDWIELAENCPHRVVDQRGKAVCRYHESAPGTCEQKFCPRWRG